MKFKVKLMDIEGENSADLMLPFPPFLGLHLQAPYRNGDFVEIGQLYWDAENNLFDAYEVDEEAR